MVVADGYIVLRRGSRIVYDDVAALHSIASRAIRPWDCVVHSSDCAADTCDVASRDCDAYRSKLFHYACACGAAAYDLVRSDAGRDVGCRAARASDRRGGGDGGDSCGSIGERASGKRQACAYGDLFCCADFLR
jgi:hypothetical protein